MTDVVHTSWTRESRDKQSTLLEHQHRRKTRGRAQRDHGTTRRRPSHDLHPRLLPTRDRLLRTSLLQRRPNPSPRRPRRLLTRLRSHWPRPELNPNYMAAGPDEPLIDQRIPPLFAQRRGAKRGSQGGIRPMMRDPTVIPAKARTRGERMDGWTTQLPQRSDPHTGSGIIF